mmetsp:Transcript_16162/g.20129  ORF Transcript_16162/g.20129 Transcript_16162/m.20129 type:complete len:125 (+) Transcript_16162:423-797(+)
MRLPLRKPGIVRLLETSAMVLSYADWVWDGVAVIVISTAESGRRLRVEGLEEGEEERWRWVVTGTGWVGVVVVTKGRVVRCLRDEGVMKALVRVVAERERLRRVDRARCDILTMVISLYSKICY